MQSAKARSIALELVHMAYQRSRHRTWNGRFCRGEGLSIGCHNVIITRQTSTFSCCHDLTLSSFIAMKSVRLFIICFICTYIHSVLPVASVCHSP